jgi:hypothetical protein
MNSPWYRVLIYSQSTFFNHDQKQILTVTLNYLNSIRILPSVGNSGGKTQNGTEVTRNENHLAQEN